MSALVGVDLCKMLTNPNSLQPSLAFTTLVCAERCAIHWVWPAQIKLFILVKIADASVLFSIWNNSSSVELLNRLRVMEKGFFMMAKLFRGCVDFGFRRISLHQ